MNWRPRDRRPGTCANDAFASELKTKIPDLARELTSSAIGTGGQPIQNRPLIGGLDQPATGDDEAQLILKDLIKLLTCR